MKFRRLAAVGATLVLALAAFPAAATPAPPPPHSADEPPKPPDSQPAVGAMTTWLHVIDEGNYGKSWDDASKLFQGALGRERWVDTMNGGRRPLGDLVKRVLKNATFRKALPGAPEGEYFVIQFNASYAGKAEALETVTAVREGVDWKAAGYFIK